MYDSTMSLYTEAGERKYLTVEERARFIQMAWQQPPQLRNLCLVLAYTGCRVSEALSLSRSSLQSTYLSIPTLKKRGKEFAVRDVPMPPKVLAALRETAPTTGSLFPYGRTWAWKHIKGVMAQSGIVGGPHATGKGIRHTFAIYAGLTKVSPNLIQRWMGHERLETTMTYLNFVGEEEIQMAQRMW